MEVEFLDETIIFVGRLFVIVYMSGEIKGEAVVYMSGEIKLEIRYQLANLEEEVEEISERRSLLAMAVELGRDEMREKREIELIKLNNCQWVKWRM
jgi:CheY-specific phosphatase CheX